MIANDASPILVQQESNPKELLKQMLAPASNKYKILYRKDEVHVHPIHPNVNNPASQYDFPGCIFLVEDVSKAKEPQQHADKGKRLLYLCWAPYTLLCEINDRLVEHERSDGGLATKADFQFNENKASASSGYVSAQINPAAPASPSSSKIKKKKASLNQTLYAFASPVHDIASIKRHIPSMGWSYMVVMMKNGVSQPPLFFHDGGIQDFFTKLNSFVSIKKSKDDSSVYNVVDTCEPLQKSLSELHFDEYFEDMYKSNHDLSWQLLEWGTKMKKTAKNLSDAVFAKKAEPLAIEEKQKRAEQILPVPKVPKKYYEMKVIPDYLGSSPPKALAYQNPQQGDDEFEIIERKDVPIPAALGKAADNWCTQPLNEESWKSYFDAEGRINDVNMLRKHVFYGGINDNIRGEVWKYLTGYYDFNSTTAERRKLDEEKRNEYYRYQTQWKNITPKQETRFALFREKKHRIEKDVVRTDRTHPMFQADDSKYLRILNDVLLTYAFYNFDLGYCQGMGDLLSPILSVIPDEVEAFWTFASLMEKMEGNFQLNSTSMETQLLALNNLTKAMDFELYKFLDDHEATNFYFCFRWILILFKREFPFDDIKRLWEALWCEQCGSNFLLFMCFAILKEHKKTIMSKKLMFDEILKYCVDLSMKMDLIQVMKLAEAEYTAYVKTMEKYITSK